MTPLGTLVLWSWIPVILFLFWWLGPRRGAMAAVIVGTLFLPYGSFYIPGFVNYDKFSATSFGLLIGIALFDARRLKTFNPSWLDLPMAVWSIVPFLSMLSNDFSLRDALAPTLDQIVLWTIPYLAARLYLRDERALRELAIAIVLAGIVYVPLCLWEVRMSPQLHHILYGFHQRSFGMLDRYGGYRPLVFLRSPLMVGIWLTAASLAAYWLWRSKQLRRIWRVPILWILPVFLATVALSKTTLALTLLLLGIALFEFVRITRMKFLVVSLLLAAALYPSLRISGMLPQEPIIEAVQVVYQDERVRSLDYRLHNEDLLAAHALTRPLLGWGGWGRERVYDASERKTSTPDGLWIIALGKYGLIGLLSLLAVHLLPAFTALWRLPARRWIEGSSAVLAGLSMILLLTWIDKLFNGMPNPIIMLVAGGVTARLTARQRQRARATAPRPVHAPSRT